MPAGRPAKYTRDFILRFVSEGAARGLNLSEISHLLNVEPCTITRYMTKNPEIKRAYMNARTELGDMLKTVVIKKAKAGDNEMIKFATKHVTDWKDETHVKGEGIANQTIIYNVNGTRKTGQTQPRREIQSA